VCVSVCGYSRPQWNPALASVLRYPLKEIQFTLEHVWQCYVTKYPEQVADGGVVPITPAEAPADYVSSATPARVQNPDVDVPMLSPEAMAGCVSEAGGLTPDSITSAVPTPSQ
jgi:hypothetical protein